MKQYKLASSPMIHTPGVMKYLECGYRTSRGKERRSFLNALSGGWNLRREIAIKLLTGKIAYEVKGDDVVFVVPDDTEVLNNAKDASI